MGVYLGIDYDNVMRLIQRNAFTAIHPFSCELRFAQAIVLQLLLLGTNDASNPDRFEENYRKVV